MSELISNLVDVCLVNLHDATKDSTSPIFPNGLVAFEDGNWSYTPEATKKYNELFDIYKSIVDESKSR